MIESTNESSDPEVALLREHEQILRAREKLEDERRRVEESRSLDRKSLTKERVEAERCADDLLQGIETLKQKVETSLEERDSGGGDKKLNDLKDNYWAMVTNVRPVWEEECKEFDERKRRKSGAGASS